MLFMLKSRNKYGGTEIQCNVCGKKDRTAYKNNTPLCFKLKRDIKEKNGKSENPPEMIHL